MNIRLSSAGVYSGGEYVTLPTVIAHLSFVSMGNYIFVEGIEGNEKEIDAEIVYSEFLY